MEPADRAEAALSTTTIARDAAWPFPSSNAAAPVAGDGGALPTAAPDAPPAAAAPDKPRVIGPTAQARVISIPNPFSPPEKDDHGPDRDAA
jgi:hypothetical protein